MVRALVRRPRVQPAGPHEDAGAVAVEFALLMPLLVMIVFGIMQFGLFFYRWQGLQALAYEGARGGSVGLSVQEIAARIEGAFSIPVSFTDVEIEVVLFDETTNTEVSRIDGKTTDPALLATTPCEGIANPQDHTLMVELRIDPTVPDYRVMIPLWGQLTIDYGTTATFGCEATA